MKARTKGPNVAASGCRYPAWPDGADREHPSFGTFCGAGRARPDLPYCSAHVALCYVRPPQVRESLTRWCAAVHRNPGAYRIQLNPMEAV